MFVVSRASLAIAPSNNLFLPVAHVSNHTQLHHLTFNLVLGIALRCPGLSTLTFVELSWLTKYPIGYRPKKYSYHRLITLGEPSRELKRVVEQEIQVK